ncbi:MAG: serine/threonine protein kinase [Actinobacteria bacterium]|nr:MAG: serine/threonine protein kinase [Actinomycetota bacterium]
MHTAEKTILDRYQIIEELGTGGFSTVYKAFDSKMERLVAIKFIPSHSKATTWAKREAKTSAHLNHPNIATIHEYDETEDGHYLIMEYLEGINLRDVLEAKEKLEIEEAIAIASQVAVALEYAHINFVVHKDIKPENLMIIADGRVKIMDFGTSRLLSQMEQSKNTLVGTPSYMSPEQSRFEITDDRCDQFSLGTVLYEMLTGKNPFEAATNKACLYKVQNQEVAPPSSLLKEIPEELDNAILKVLSKDRENRYATITDFRYKVERSYNLPANSRQIVKNLYEQFVEVEEESLGPQIAKRDNLLEIARDIIGRIYAKNSNFVGKLFSVLLFVAFVLSIGSGLWLGVAYPLLVGVTHRPKKAIALACPAALLLGLFAPIGLKAAFGSIYITHLFHILLWTATALIVSILSLKRSFKNDALVYLIGMLILISGYLLLPGLKEAGLDKVMQSVSLSLIISLAILSLTPYDYLDIGKKDES